MSSGMRPLTPTGKPMTALRILAGASRPLYEQDIWTATRETHGPATWHAELAALVRRGYATRSGARGGYHYEITKAGREAIRP